jgi:Leucine-rich repeat (LRR) protein
MVESIRDKWQRSLQVIRVANEDELAVVEFVDLRKFAFKAIQPDAHFLFRKTFHLKMKIAIPTVTSINISPDSFAIIHFMPDLRSLELWFDEPVDKVEFNPTAFDQLPFLKKIDISGDDDLLLDTFETGLVARTMYCDRVKLLKLNSAAVDKITQIIMFVGMVESKEPLSGLKNLQISPDETTDFSILFRQCTDLNILSLTINDLSQLDQGQLSHLPSLKRLEVNCQDSVTESIYFNYKRANLFEICINIEILLGNNGMHKLSGEGEMFKGLVLLESLFIHSFKSIRVIETGAFKHVSDTLEHLDLSNNSIETIEPGALECLSKLKTFDIRGNRLTDVQLASLRTELPSVSLSI